MLCFKTKPVDGKNVLIMLLFGLILSYFPTQGILYGKIALSSQKGRPSVEVTVDDPTAFWAILIILASVAALSLIGALLEGAGINISFDNPDVETE
jgi:hypothetical protein